MIVGGRSVPSANQASGHANQGSDPSPALISPAPACSIWGVLNVTPDSFSDGGAYLDPARAVSHAQHLVRLGADVVDVGGESSRPAGKTYGAGFEHVTVEEELRRVLPVVQALVLGGIRVSVDTVKAEVAREALRCGAHIINDVSCGRSEALLEVVASSSAELVLMHTRGQGECHGDNVCYSDVVSEVRDELLAALAKAERYGVGRERIWLDPGLGFAKTSLQSFAVLNRVETLLATGQRVLVGASRKSFVGEVAKSPSGEVLPPGRRLGATAAAVTLAALQGAHGVRVHDVEEMYQAVRVALASLGGRT